MKNDKLIIINDVVFAELMDNEPPKKNYDVWASDIGMAVAQEVSKRFKQYKKDGRGGCGCGACSAARERGI